MRAGDPNGDVFVEPGNVVRRNARLGDSRPAGATPERMPQMPAWHVVQPDNGGTTLINIGTGPSNARNITDHVAVLRPHAWLMLGHCAGLRNTQTIGDYVLAHGYVREDRVLDEELPLWVPIPALAEIQVAIELSVSEVTGLSGFELKRIMRTGTVASVDNRNWELGDHVAVLRKLHSPVRSRSTWNLLRSPRTAFVFASPTERFFVSRTSRCTAKSSSRAWPVNSTVSESGNISRSGSKLWRS